MGGTRESENAETLRTVGTIEQCRAFECGWQYPLTANDNPEVAARVQALWGDYDTKRLFGAYEVGDVVASGVHHYEDVAPLCHTIAKLPLPLRATETERPYRLRPGEDDAPQTLKEQFFESMATAEQRLEDPSSYSALLHNQLGQYQQAFPGEPHREVEGDMLGVTKRLLYSASRSYDHPLCNAHTVEQPLYPQNPEAWENMYNGIARLEIELECVDEKCSEGGGTPVSGMHLNWPYHPDDSAYEFHRVTIVRQVRRWRIVVDRDKLEWLSLNERALEVARQQLEALSQLKPMFVSGICHFHYVTQDGQGFPQTSAIAALDQETYIAWPLHLIEFRSNPKPVLDSRGRLASPIALRDAPPASRVPISEYELVRTGRWLNSPHLLGHPDCRVGQQLLRQWRTKCRLKSVLHKTLADTYAPGKPGAERAKAEWGAMNEARKEDPRMARANEQQRRDRAALLRQREAEIRRDPRHGRAPPLLSERSRSRSWMQEEASLAGGVPNLARLKL